MIDLRKLAVLLIYPDGSIDDEEVIESSLHMDYFRELRRKSEKFRNITNDLDFGVNYQYDMDLFLVKSGIILMYNEDLGAAVHYSKDYEIDFEPNIIVCLPEEYASREQKENFYEIIRGYDKKLLHFGRFKNYKSSFSEGNEVRKYVLEDDLMRARGGR